MDNMPIVRVSFYIAGEDFDNKLDQVTATMGISPTETRTRNSFKIDYFKHTEWIIEISKDNCRAISIVFEKLCDILDEKQQKIKDICEQYKATAGFVVIVDMQKEDSPEIVLTSNIISFAASVNAKIGFDIYRY